MTSTSAVATPKAVMPAAVPLLLVAEATLFFTFLFIIGPIATLPRLIPLGQTDGQHAVAALMPIILDIVPRALQTPLDELGAAAPAVDIASMRHETQHTRLFRS